MAPGQIVGAGVDEPQAPADPARFRAKFGLSGSYALYVGRVQKEKGCDTMFASYLGLPAGTRKQFPLVVLGKTAMPIPESPDIRYGGFVDEDVKRDGLAGAEVVLLPSPYESLSLVALEAWQSGAPVLVNGDCEVLKNHCRRSQAGLWYQGPDEFREAFLWLSAPENAPQRRSMVENGRRYVERGYRWNCIVEKYREAGEPILRGDAQRR
jgi:glycosyltransferase involved in cell wall biosynthesis